MIGLTPKEESEKVEAGDRTYNPDTVRVAVECARGITSIVKAQLDGLKVLKEFQ